LPFFVQKGKKRVKEWSDKEEYTKNKAKNNMDGDNICSAPLSAQAFPLYLLSRVQISNFAHLRTALFI